MEKINPEVNRTALYCLERSSNLNLATSLRWTPLIPVLSEIIRHPESSEDSVKLAIGHLEDLAKKADRIADLITAGRIEIKDAS